MSTLLSLNDVAFRYDAPTVLDGVTLSVGGNEVVGLIGPNGSGKSTLLQVAIGVLRPDRGEVVLGEVPVDRLERREIARRAAIVPQDAAIGMAFSVREIVSMGRNPHLGRFDVARAADREAVDRAIVDTELTAFTDRPITELSGGERQRVMIARVLAQDPALMLLDEPTSHLDLVHQLEILDLVRRFVSTGRGALVAIHDLSLASRYCDRLLLLYGGRIVAEGTPAGVLTEENLRRYFGVHAQVRHNQEGLQVSAIAPAGPSD